MTLDCKHRFCANCCEALIKISKIKKGLHEFRSNLVTIEGEPVDPLKCPKCNEINRITEGMVVTW